MLAWRKYNLISFSLVKNKISDKELSLNMTFWGNKTPSQPLCPLAKNTQSCYQVEHFSALQRKGNNLIIKLITQSIGLINLEVTPFLISLWALCLIHI